MVKIKSQGLDRIGRWQFDLLVCLWMALLTGVAGYGIVHDRIATMQAAHRSALNIANALQLHISAELLQASYTVEAVRGDLDHRGEASKAAMLKSVQLAMRYDPISAYIGIIDGPTAILVDRSGRVVDNPGLMSAVEREIVSIPSARALETLPLIYEAGARNGYLPLVLGASGSASEGAIVFSLTPAQQLVEAASSLELVSDGRFSVFTPEGTRLFRYLGAQKSFDLPPASVHPPWLRDIESEPRGTVEGISAVDGHYDVIGYSRSENLPFIVVAGMPRVSLDLAWLQRSVGQLLLLLVGGLATIISGARLRRAVADLSSSHSLLSQLFGSVNDGLVILRRDGVIQRSNPAAARILQVESEEQLTGVNLFGLTQPDRSAGIVAGAGLDSLRDLQPGDVRSCDWRFRYSDGTGAVDVKLQLSALPGEGDTLVTALLRDVTKEREYLRKQEFLARHDTLTGLLNRYAFLDHVASRIRFAPAESFAVALLDLNRFKEVNDSLGHHEGDLVLKSLGARLRQMFAKHPGCIARLGGDEIALCVDPAAWPDGMPGLCNALHETIQQPFLADTTKFEISASVGIAMYPVDAAAPEQLLRCADIAMYSAKRSMTPVAWYSEKLESHSTRSLTLKSDFAQAIRDEALTLAYQPKINLRDGALLGFEALARWHHPCEGTISPGVFVPLAETTELIYPFTRQVLKMAIAQLSEWSGQGHDVTVSVNVSAHNLLDAEFVDQISGVLHDHAVLPDRLELEVTESALMRDPDAAVDQLHRIREIGVQLAIDDFGTGHSSLAYLKRLPVQILKIDQSFIASLPSDAADRRIVKSSIALAHSFGMRVVAEGVETQEIAGMLTIMGCDIAQGYFYGRPETAQEVTRRWLARDENDAADRERAGQRALSAG